MQKSANPRFNLNPGFRDTFVSSTAHSNLGHLLYTKRQDFDGAEAAFRVAIAADPGFAMPMIRGALGDVLEIRANQIEASGGDLATAAALHDECAQVRAVSKGAGHKLAKSAQD